MPDTSAAREAILRAYDIHRDVNGGLSLAELKLQAAGGLLRDADPLPFAEDDPVWIEHARNGLLKAMTACDALRTAITAAQVEVGELLGEDGSDHG